ncbi:MAG: LacI family DNA-binding transcriptional regulator, partial [Nitrosarchaeum sp.]
MANIGDVAKEAGVALGTVSAVINGDDKVSEVTKNKVKQAMEKLDYIPNQLARAMFKQQSGIVAMLVPSIKHPFFASVAEEIEKTLFQKGKRLMLCGTGSLEKVEKDYIEFFKTNIVDALRWCLGEQKSS